MMTDETFMTDLELMILEREKLEEKLAEKESVIAEKDSRIAELEAELARYKSK